MSRLLSFMLLVLLVAAAVFVPQTRQTAVAQSAPQIEFRGQVTVPDSGNIKFPQIRGRGTIAHLAGSGGSGNNNNPLYWRKNADGSTSFPNPIDLGTARGEPNYAVTDVTIAPNGRVYVIWNHTGDNAIYMLSSSDGASWNTNDRKTVIDDSSFRVYTRVGAANDRLWVVWNQDGKYRYRTTSDINGSGWSGTQQLSSRTAINQPSIAVSPDGNRAAVGYASNAGDIYVGIWNGSTFVERTVSNTGEYLVDPTITFGPDNRIWMAWRAVEGRIYFTREDDNGNFSASRLTTAESFGQVSISVDPQGTPHVFWVGNRGDGWKAYYARQVNGVWGIATADPGTFIANGSGATTVSDYAYGHGVTEYFSGSTVSTRYYLFRSAGGCQVTISVASNVAGANPPIVNQPTVSGTLTPSAGCTPDQQRVALNAPDTNQPATAWTAAFSNVPIANLKQCQQTVYAQVRTSGGTSFSTWSSAAFVADPATASPAVDAVAEAMNPKIYGAMASVFPPIAPAGDLFDQGPSTGDPGYTRSQQMYLRIADLGDCTGLASYRAVTAPTPPTTPVQFIIPTAITGGHLTGIVPVPSAGDPAPGQRDFDLYVRDVAGNERKFDRTIIVDLPDTPVAAGAGRPVMDLNDTTITPDNNTLTILRQLTINEISVTDNLYRRGLSVPARNYTNIQTPADNGTNRYWGVWIAVEYLGKDAGAATTYPALPEVELNKLRWQPIEVRNAAGTPAVTFNMFDGVLNRTVTPNTNGFGPDLTKDGTYRVYVKALDGAGNASNETYTATMTLAPGYEVITSRLPVVYR